MNWRQIAHSIVVDVAFIRWIRCDLLFKSRLCFLVCWPSQRCSWVVPLKSGRHEDHIQEIFCTAWLSFNTWRVHSVEYSRVLDITHRRDLLAISTNQTNWAANRPTDRPINPMARFADSGRINGDYCCCCAILSMREGQCPAQIIINVYGRLLFAMTGSSSTISTPPSTCRIYLGGHAQRAPLSRDLASDDWMHEARLRWETKRHYCEHSRTLLLFFFERKWDAPCISD